MYKIPANTVFMGKRVIYMPECHSTNDEGHRLVQAQEGDDGTIIITDSQPGGRGQRGNRWLAEPGKSLTFSIVVKPKRLRVSDQSLLTMVVSLGIHDWLSDLLPKEITRIKWPNDVLVNDRKICGILIENHVAGNFISHAIIGIGINVNQSNFNVPQAISLKMVTGKTFELQTCFEELVACIEVRYLMLDKKELALIKAGYLERLYWIGEQHLFSSSGIRFTGTITGTDEFGRLEIETNGIRKSFDLKEVTFIR
jgi:BirA family biotin operon repressor/biotin-[acetyl-CoA-carboxylase] ligase